MSNVMGIYVKFWLVLPWPLIRYGHVTWPRLQSSKMFNFSLILHLILGNAIGGKVKHIISSLITSIWMIM